MVVDGGGRQHRRWRPTMTGGGNARGQTVVGGGGRCQLVATDNGGDSRGQMVAANSGR